ncbi:predicted protein [Nematostella vectensis]|uniref:Proteasome assembly chaperone 2 n=1 Tax=Nematostella vectensis TaxID=45351 RepID=PSMG2_NEMVE|nr:RecName: Full=Proteasome assembly chaperone 2 [Nematostella vectensis]EDO37041.1 predicted protein [Nematostella vectensis]|eukprot:XP_001629104.1 predicted protein [Nematostella vectensis]
MFVPCAENVNDLDFSGFTLILPAVSIGNVGQLATDLTISSLSSSRHLIGYLHDASILPVVGNDAFARLGHEKGELNLSAEVYQSTEKRLVIVQQRAPISKGHYANYCQKLLAWIKRCSFKQVVLLSSISATDRVDAQLQGSPLRYMTTSVSQQLSSSFDKLSWVQLEKRPKFPDMTKESDELQFYLPGGGVTKRFFDRCEKEDVPLAVLMTFCSEGDNIADAVSLFLYLNDWLEITNKDTVGVN